MITTFGCATDVLSVVMERGVRATNGKVTHEECDRTASRVSRPDHEQTISSARCARPTQHHLHITLTHSKMEKKSLTNIQTRFSHMVADDIILLLLYSVSYLRLTSRRQQRVEAESYNIVIRRMECRRLRRARGFSCRSSGVQSGKRAPPPNASQKVIEIRASSSL